MFDAEGVCRFSSHTGTCVCTPDEVVTETTFRSSKGRHAVISGMGGMRSHPITMAHTCDAQVWLQRCAAGTGDDAALCGLARAPRARQANITPRGSPTLQASAGSSPVGSLRLQVHATVPGLS